MVINTHKLGTHFEFPQLKNTLYKITHKLRCNYWFGFVQTLTASNIHCTEIINKSCSNLLSQVLYTEQYLNQYTCTIKCIIT